MFGTNVYNYYKLDLCRMVCGKKCLWKRTVNERRGCNMDKLYSSTPRCDGNSYSNNS